MTTAWAQEREEASLRIKRDVLELVNKIEPILHVLYDDCMALIAVKAHEIKFELYSEIWQGGNSGEIDVFVIRDQLFHILRYKHTAPDYIESAIEDLLRLCRYSYR